MEYKCEKDETVKEAVFLFRKPHNFCSAVTNYYFESAEAAEAKAEKINEARNSMYSESATVTPLPVGAVLTITEPYDD